MNKHMFSGRVAATILLTVAGPAFAAEPAEKASVAPAQTGGPLILAGSAEASADLNASRDFRSLFSAWKKLDGGQGPGGIGQIAIPSVQPVAKMDYSSNFGIRSDPFRGTAAMHAGGRMAEIVFRDKDFEGKPIPKNERQKKLFAQSQRMLRDVKVEGGYQLGDDAVVVFTARNGSGGVST